MRAFVTGATGFVGGRLARRLRERGDDVVALVRSPERAAPLAQLGCELRRGDLEDQSAIREGLESADAAFHVAAAYRVGIRPSERPAMFEANVRGTARVLDAAVDAGVSRIVYVSTIGCFGNTRGKVVDETFERARDGYLSYYEETKVLAHDVALERIRAGGPAVIVMPGGIYGPGDTSDLGNLIGRVRTGKLPAKVFPETGFNWVHVDDVVDGILLAHDRGRIGESYVLGGELGTIGSMIDAIAAAAGRRPPRITIPPAVVKMGIPFAPLVTKAFGMEPNLRELIRSGEGVTYWASHDKARRELGYTPRDLRTGITQTLAEVS